MTNLKTQRDQCQRDIEALQINLNKIDKEIKDSKVFMVGVGDHLILNWMGTPRKCTVVRGPGKFVGLIFMGHKVSYPNYMPGGRGWEEVDNPYHFPLSTLSLVISEYKKV